MQKLINAIACALRNRKRCRLMREYNRNALRNKRILAQLGIIEAGRELEQQTDRILDYWPAAGSLKKQAEVIRPGAGLGLDAIQTAQHIANLGKILRQQGAEPCRCVAEEA